MLGATATVACATPRINKFEHLQMCGVCRSLQVIETLSQDWIVHSHCVQLFKIDVTLARSVCINSFFNDATRAANKEAHASRGCRCKSNRACFRFILQFNKQIFFLVVCVRSLPFALLIAKVADNLIDASWKHWLRLHKANRKQCEATSA